MKTTTTTHGITYHHHATEKFATLCAWCDRQKVATNYLRSQGYTVSHGICPSHKRDMIQDVARLRASRQLNLV